MKKDYVYQDNDKYKLLQNAQRIGGFYAGDQGIVPAERVLPEQRFAHQPIFRRPPEELVTVFSYLNGSLFSGHSNRLAIANSVKKQKTIDVDTGEEGVDLTYAYTGWQYAKDVRNFVLKNFTEDAKATPQLTWVNGCYPETYPISDVWEGEEASIDISPIIFKGYIWFIINSSAVLFSKLSNKKIDTKEIKKTQIIVEDPLTDILEGLMFIYKEGVDYKLVVYEAGPFYHYAKGMMANWLVPGNFITLSVSIGAWLSDNFTFDCRSGNYWFYSTTPFPFDSYSPCNGQYYLNRVYTQTGPNPQTLPQHPGWDMIAYWYTNPPPIEYPTPPLSDTLQDTGWKGGCDYMPILTPLDEEGRRFFRIVGPCGESASSEIPPGYLYSGGYWDSGVVWTGAINTWIITRPFGFSYSERIKQYTAKNLEGPWVLDTTWNIPIEITYPESLIVPPYGMAIPNYTRRIKTEDPSYIAIIQELGSLILSKKQSELAMSLRPWFTTNPTQTRIPFNSSQVLLDILRQAYNPPFDSFYLTPLVQSYGPEGEIVKGVNNDYPNKRYLVKRLGNGQIKKTPITGISHNH